MVWESVTVLLSHDLAVRADFEVKQGKVHEFKVVLEKADDQGVPGWLVRYETHGGRAHKHERWDDQNEGRHKHPTQWRGDHDELLTKAIEDLKQRHMEYEARYDAWKQNENR